MKPPIPTQPDLFCTLAPNEDGKLEVPFNELSETLVRMREEGLWTSNRMDVDRKRGLYVLHCQPIPR
jgi:hypothetical protein